MRILACALALALPAGQDFDKTKHQWGKWKVDTRIKFKMTIEVGGQSIEGEYRSALTELKDKEYTLRHASSVMGAEQEEFETETYGEKKGEEKIKVGDQEHECVVWASSGKRGEKELSSRLWIPAGKETPLKMTWKAGDDESGEFTATKMSENLSAGGKDYDCVLLEGEMTSPELGGTLKGKMWMHPSVPGGVVRLDLSGDQAKIAVELADVDAKK